MTYQEKQLLRNNRFFWIIIPALLIILFVNIPVANGKSNQWLHILISIAFSIVSIALIFLANLSVEINSDGISYQWFPLQFSKRKIAWAEIQKAYIRHYDPLLEYGGWGIKGWKKSNKAINIAGKIGLQLELINGNRLLIGTAQEKLLQQYLDQFAKMNIKALN